MSFLLKSGSRDAFGSSDPDRTVSPAAMRRRAAGGERTGTGTSASLPRGGSSRSKRKGTTTSFVDEEAILTLEHELLGSPTPTGRPAKGKSAIAGRAPHGGSSFFVLDDTLASVFGKPHGGSSSAAAGAASGAARSRGDFVSRTGADSGNWLLASESLQSAGMKSPGSPGGRGAFALKRTASGTGTAGTGSAASEATDTAASAGAPAGPPPKAKPVNALSQPRSHTQVTTLAKEAIASLGHHVTDTDACITFRDTLFVLTMLGVPHSEPRARQWFQAIPPPRRSPRTDSLTPDGFHMFLSLVSRVQQDTVLTLRDAFYAFAIRPDPDDDRRPMTATDVLAKARKRPGTSGLYDDDDDARSVDTATGSVAHLIADNADGDARAAADRRAALAASLNDSPSAAAAPGAGGGVRPGMTKREARQQKLMEGTAGMDAAVATATATATRTATKTADSSAAAGGTARAGAGTSDASKPAGAPATAERKGILSPLSSFFSPSREPEPVYVLQAGSTHGGGSDHGGAVTTGSGSVDTARSGMPFDPMAAVEGDLNTLKVDALGLHALLNSLGLKISTAQASALLVAECERTAMLDEGGTQAEAQAAFNRVLKKARAEFIKADVAQATMMGSSEHSRREGRDALVSQAADAIVRASQETIFSKMAAVFRKKEPDEGSSLGPLAGGARFAATAPGATDLGFLNTSARLSYAQVKALYVQLVNAPSELRRLEDVRAAMAAKRKRQMARLKARQERGRALATGLDSAHHSQVSTSSVASSVMRGLRGMTTNATGAFAIRGRSAPATDVTGTSTPARGRSGAGEGFKPAVGGAPAVAADGKVVKAVASQQSVIGVATVTSDSAPAFDTPAGVIHVEESGEDDSDSEAEGSDRSGRRRARRGAGDKQLTLRTETHSRSGTGTHASAGRGLFSPMDDDDSAEDATRVRGDDDLFTPDEDSPQKKTGTVASIMGGLVTRAAAAAGAFNARARLRQVLDEDDTATSKQIAAALHEAAQLAKSAPPLATTFASTLKSNVVQEVMRTTVLARELQSRQQQVQAMSQTAALLAGIRPPPTGTPALMPPNTRDDFLRSTSPIGTFASPPASRAANAFPGRSPGFHYPVTRTEAGFDTMMTTTDDNATRGVSPIASTVIPAMTTVSSLPSLSGQPALPASAFAANVAPLSAAAARSRTSGADTMSADALPRLATAASYVSSTGSLRTHGIDGIGGSMSASGVDRSASALLSPELHQLRSRAEQVLTDIPQAMGPLWPRPTGEKLNPKNVRGAANLIHTLAAVEHAEKMGLTGTATPGPSVFQDSTVSKAGGGIRMVERQSAEGSRAGSSTLAKTASRAALGAAAPRRDGSMSPSRGDAGDAGADKRKLKKNPEESLADRAEKASKLALGKATADMAAKLQIALEAEHDAQERMRDHAADMQADRVPTEEADPGYAAPETAGMTAERARVKESMHIPGAPGLVIGALSGTAGDVESIAKAHEQLASAAAASQVDLINIAGHNVTSVPAHFWSTPEAAAALPNVLCFDASANRIRSVPERSFFDRLTALQKLDFTGNELESLPDSVAHMRSLMVCRLGSNRLKVLNPALFQCSRLTILDLSANALKELPGEVGECTGIRSLLLQHNQLETLPSTIGRLSSLEVLDVAGNGLLTLPATLMECTAISYLNVSNNRLNFLVEEIGKLRHLAHLDASFNALRSLPASLGDCRRLQILRLSTNGIRFLPRPMKNLRHLVELDLSHNKLKLLDPHILERTTQLQRLDASHNEIETVPYTIGYCVLLEELRINNNRLSSLPAEIGSCRYLRKMFLQYNELGLVTRELTSSDIGSAVDFSKALTAAGKKTLALEEAAVGRFGAKTSHEIVPKKGIALAPSDPASQPSGVTFKTATARLIDAAKSVKKQILPDTLSVLPVLEYLDISHNQSSWLPGCLALAPRLTYLNASHNFLTDLDDAVCKSQSIVTLDVSYNRLEHCSNVLGGAMQSLETLDLSCNLLVRLPDSLGLCVNLRHLFASGNRLANIPSTIGPLLHILETFDVTNNPMDELPAQLPWHEPQDTGDEEGPSILQTMRNTVDRAREVLPGMSLANGFLRPRTPQGAMDPLFDAVDDDLDFAAEAAGATPGKKAGGAADAGGAGRGAASATGMDPSGQAKPGNIAMENLAMRIENLDRQIDSDMAIAREAGLLQPSIVMSPSFMSSSEYSSEDSSPRPRGRSGAGAGGSSSKRASVLRSASQTSASSADSRSPRAFGAGTASSTATDTYGSGSEGGAARPSPPQRRKKRRGAPAAARFGTRKLQGGAPENVYDFIDWLYRRVERSQRQQVMAHVEYDIAIISPQSGGKAGAGSGGGSAHAVGSGGGSSVPRAGSPAFRLGPVPPAASPPAAGRGGGAAAAGASPPRAGTSPSPKREAAGAAAASMAGTVSPRASVGLHGSGSGSLLLAQSSTLSAGSGLVAGYDASMVARPGSRGRPGDDTDTPALDLQHMSPGHGIVMSMPPAGVPASAMLGAALKTSNAVPEDVKVASAQPHLRVLSEQAQFASVAGDASGVLAADSSGGAEIFRTPRQRLEDAYVRPPGAAAAVPLPGDGGGAASGGRPTSAGRSARTPRRTALPTVHESPASEMGSGDKRAGHGGARAGAHADDATGFVDEDAAFGGSAAHAADTFDDGVSVAASVGAGGDRMLASPHVLRPSGGVRFATGSSPPSAVAHQASLASSALSGQSSHLASMPPGAIPIDVDPYLHWGSQHPFVRPTADGSYSYDPQDAAAGGGRRVGPEGSLGGEGSSHLYQSISGPPSLYTAAEETALGPMSTTPAMYQSSVLLSIMQGAGTRVDHDNMRRQFLGGVTEVGSGMNNSAVTVTTVPPADMTLARWDRNLKFSESFSREGTKSATAAATQRAILTQLAAYAPDARTLHDALRMPLLQAAAKEAVAMQAFGALDAGSLADSELDSAIADDAVARHLSGEFTGQADRSLVMVAGNTADATTMVHALAPVLAGGPAMLSPPPSGPHAPGSIGGASHEVAIPPQPLWGRHMGRTSDPRWVGPDHMAGHVGEVAQVASTLAGAMPGSASTADVAVLVRPGMAAGLEASIVTGGVAPTLGGGSVVVTDTSRVGNTAGSPYALGLQSSVGGDSEAGGGGVTHELGGTRVLVPLARYNPQASTRAGMEPNAGGIGVGGVMGLPVQLSRGESMDLLAASLASTSMPRLDVQAFGLAAAKRHRSRVSIRELKAQSINAQTNAVLQGRGLMFGYSNADIAQYAILVTIFAKHAEQEWIVRGGIYLSGRGTSHEFVGHVVRRVMAEYSAPAYALPPPPMAASVLPPPGIDGGLQPISSVATQDMEEAMQAVSPFASAEAPPGLDGCGVMTGSKVRAAFSTTLPAGGSGVAAHSRSLDGMPSSMVDQRPTASSSFSHGGAPAAPPGFAPVDLVNSRSLAFASLPALLGDVWNESFLALIYHYYVRANTDGCPPGFGQLEDQETARRAEARRKLQAFRDLVKTLREKRREAMAEKAALTAAGKIPVELMKKAARRAARKMVRTKAHRAQEALEKLQAAHSELRKLVIRRRLRQDGKAESIAKARRDALLADQTMWRRYAAVRAYNMDLREAMLAEDAGLNPMVAMQKHVRRTLQAVQTSVIDQLEAHHKRMRRANGIATPLSWPPPSGHEPLLLEDGAPRGAAAAASAGAGAAVYGYGDGYPLLRDADSDSAGGRSDGDHEDGTGDDRGGFSDPEIDTATAAATLKASGSVLWDAGHDAGAVDAIGVADEDPTAASRTSTSDTAGKRATGFLPPMPMPQRSALPALPPSRGPRVTISQGSLETLASRHGRRFNASRGLNVKLTLPDGTHVGAHSAHS